MEDKLNNGMRAPLFAIAVITLLLLFLGISFDYPTALDGSFYSDCATYYMLTSSLAHDFDLEYKRDDIQRVYQDFRGGPAGLFLQFNRETGRIYYGKSFIYPLVLAPAVRLFGPRGILMTHALILGALLLAMTLLWERHWGRMRALLCSLAFILPSVATVFYFWIAPEFFNFALILFACFLWLYKEINPRQEAEEPPRWRKMLLSFWSDPAALFLLGVATFSKLSNGILILPVFLYLLIKGRWKELLLGGLAFFVAVSLLFGAQFQVTGHWNYQGGERKSFHTEFPFANGKSFETAQATPMETNVGQWEFPFFPVDIAHNIVYFFIGRFGGILPYYFPAVLAMVLFLLLERRSLVRWLVLGGAVAAAFVYIILIPTNVIGGGGTVANRYFMNIFPLFFFLLPRRIPGWFPGIAALGGALFMGHILVNPIFHSRFPSHYSETPVLDILPVEYTMLNDLPMRTDSDRSRMEWYKVENGKVVRDQYGPAVEFYLYNLDHNTYIKEPNPNDWFQGPDGIRTRNLLTSRGTQQIWTVGGRRAEMILRTGEQKKALRIQVSNSATNNEVTISVQGKSEFLKMKPRERTTLTFELGPAFVYHYLNPSYLYPVNVTTSSGVTPRTLPEGGEDYRNLGVMLEFWIE